MKIAYVCFFILCFLFAVKKVAFIGCSGSGGGEAAAEPAAHSCMSMDALEKRIAGVKVMRRLSEEDHHSIAEVCEQMSFSPGATVFKQGDAGDYFYIICEGEAIVSELGEDGETVVKKLTLKDGDCFGENALLYNAARIATVNASGAGQLSVLAISVDNFTELGLQTKLAFANRQPIFQRLGVAHLEKRTTAKQQATPKTAQEIDMMIAALLKSDIVKDIAETLSRDRLVSLVDTAWEKATTEGECLFEKGDTLVDVFYIIKSGTFEIGGDESDYGIGKHLGSGCCFGEVAMLIQAPRSRTFTSLTTGSVWVIHRNDFREALAQLSEDRMDTYTQMLDRVEILETLPKEEMRELANGLVEMHFRKGEVILTQGEVGETFFIISEGEVSVEVDATEVRHLQATPAVAPYFGEHALLSGDSKRTATVTVTSEEAAVLALDRARFESILGPLANTLKMMSIHEVRQTLHDGQNPVVIKTTTGRSDSEKTFVHVPLSEIRRVGMLGCGAFGIVELYEHPTRNEYYALKTLSKGKVVQMGMQEQVLREKALMQVTSSPFIVRLLAAYNNPQTFGLLLEVLLGGELHTVYVRERLFGSEKHARYYSAGIVLALDSLHKNHILFRDLKPENVVLDESGIPKLTDFGLAKQAAGKTYTMCGTPEYFAPEVLQGIGHNQGVDWWALGVFVFELMTGTTPFRAPQVLGICNKISRGINDVKFPAKCAGPAADFVKALLQQRSPNRLPMRVGGVLNITQHKWYEPFEWQDIVSRCPSKVPFTPKVKDRSDLTNFDEPIAIPEEVLYVDDGSGWDRDFATNADWKEDSPPASPFRATQAVPASSDFV
jgi:cGMP-dependent protein kinase